LKIPAKVRDSETGDLERKETLEEAVTWCIAHGILKEFLETHASGGSKYGIEGAEFGSRVGSRTGRRP
jgi:hypothetical protein